MLLPHSNSNIVHFFLVFLEGFKFDIISAFKRIKISIALKNLIRFDNINCLLIHPKQRKKVMLLFLEERYFTNWGEIISHLMFDEKEVKLDQD